MNGKKLKDINRIEEERSELWIQIFIRDYFKFAQRSGYPAQIYGKLHITFVI